MAVDYAVITEDGTETVYEFAQGINTDWTWTVSGQLLVKVTGLSGSRTWSLDAYMYPGNEAIIEESGLAADAWVSLGPAGGLTSAGDTLPAFRPARVVVTLSGAASGTQIHLQAERRGF